MARPRLFVALLALLILSTGLCRIGQAAPPALSDGDILFADPTALPTGVMSDEFELNGRGAIYKQDPATGDVTILSEGQTFVDPTNLVLEPAGTLLVVDQNWGENQQSTGGAGGAVLRIDPSGSSTTNATKLSSGGEFVDPVGITLNPATGEIYVCDRNGSSGGKIIQINPTTGAQTLLSSGGALVNPQDLVWADDQLYVVDPLTDNTDSGYIVKIDPDTGDQVVFAGGGYFVDPVGIDVDPESGNLLIADEEAGTDGFGAIIEVDHVTGAQTAIASDGNLEHPRDVARESATSLIATDPVFGFGVGATIRVARADGVQTVLATGEDTPDDFVEPLGIQVVRNFPPTVQANKTVIVAQDSVNNPLDIAMPTDPEGDSFTVTVNVVPNAASGFVHVSGSMTALAVGNTLTAAQLPNLQFDTVTGASGSAGMFIYTADDGDAAASQVITLAISAGGAPVAFDQTFSGTENTPRSLTLPASDPDGDSLTYTVVSGPSHGSVDGGTSPNRTYTPDAGYNGSDSFTFKANDGMLDSNVATIFLNIGAVNDPPVVSNQSATIDEDTTKDFDLTPSDPDVGDSFSYTILSGPSHGMLSGTGDIRTYTPTANYHGTDSFTYKANDGSEDSNTATVSITINPVNDPPVANPTSFSTLEDTAYNGTLTGSDVDGNTIYFGYDDAPDHGSLVLFPDGQFTYTPTANYHGPDSFIFHVYDGTVDSPTVTVEITVLSDNDAPVAVGNTYNTPRGTVVEPAAPGVLGNDTDVEGDTLTAKLVTNVTGGSLVLNANGSFRYVPRIGFTGPDSFTYKAFDGEDDSNVVAVTINVSPDPPVSTPDGRVEGSGTIAVTGGNGTFSISARKTSGIVMGSVVYTDPNRQRTMTSTQLTSVVVTGKKARVFGKGKRPDGVLVDFVVDVNDVAEPGRLKDTFQIELSTNTTTGPGTLTLGNITVTGGTAPAPLAPTITKKKPKRRH